MIDGIDRLILSLNTNDKTKFFASIKERFQTNSS